MMEEKFSILINLLWERCIKNLNNILTEDEANKFSNNDYYYLLVIQSLQKPNLSLIAEKLSLTKPAVSVIVRKLMNMNLITKVQSVEDKRVFIVELTEKGSNILSGDRSIYKWVTDNMADIVDKEEDLKIIEKIIFGLVERLEGMNE
ncbi:winged helix-turn-helix transcriptional regulator [Candidatus Galacturonibacter soehngenii]|uniref:HTH-type transcriptional regulator SarZ n=2 Tax=Candidatus Galacturonatibacter soehngenii TaxID=2307010 RepID=A0A7V7UAP6_9FIRM|nr:winged helix-turn-helix transcriptional regulator [Candidatus Galacturonibacter soehngenii]